MMRKNILALLFVCIFLIYFGVIFSCTENPLDTPDRIGIPDKILKGKVKMNDNSSPENVYVWLEGFDIGAYLDAAGQFKIILPPPQLQPSGGISGTFNLYFYISNFYLDSSQIVLQNGKLSLDHADVNDQGALRNPKYLRKMLKIDISATPNIVPENFDSYIFIDLILEAAEDTIYIKYPDKAAGPMAILIFKSKSSENQLIKFYENSPNASVAPMYTDSISMERKRWSSGFRFSTNFLPIGEYEIIPYFVIIQNAIPEDLINNFGNNIHQPNVDFANIPTQRNGDGLLVTKAEVLP